MRTAHMHSFDHCAALSFCWFIFHFISFHVHDLCHVSFFFHFSCLNNFYICCPSMRWEFCFSNFKIMHFYFDCRHCCRSAAAIQMNLMRTYEMQEKIQRTKVKNEWTNEWNWERPEYWTGFNCPQPIANSPSINVIIGRQAGIQMHTHIHTHT